MPDPEGDPISTWKESFGMEPSAPIATSLRLLTKHNPVSEIIDAVCITATNLDIIGETDRMKYVRGILHQKQLAREQPEKAAEAYKQNRAVVALQSHWNKQPRGSHYFDKRVVKNWLRFLSGDEIKAAMDEAEGYWPALREEIKRRIDTRKQSQEQPAPSDAASLD
jgi:hypothetical protein